MPCGFWPGFTRHLLPAREASKTAGGNEYRVSHCTPYTGFASDDAILFSFVPWQMLNKSSGSAAARHTSSVTSSDDELLARPDPT